MGREIKRVPLDFKWTLNKVWEGFLLPEEFHHDPCSDCEGGYSWQYQRLHDLWYGKVPFDPALSGSALLTVDTPAVREFAERQVRRSPDYYGSGEEAVVREAERLIQMWNQMWMHHLSQADVDALVDGGRLYDFTHTVVPGKGWQPKDEPVRPTAAQVNEWSLRGLGHDGISQYVVIKARCERYGTPFLCKTCKGEGGLEVYPGQSEEAEAWEPVQPPEGEGWQLWETVTEGSPISPVFPAPEALARWMSSPAYSWGISKGGDISYEDALGFVRAGWAPTGVSTPERGFESGEQFIGRENAADAVALEKTREDGE